ncbi:unnamed protein product [Soboliphyme baturini]|uniref:Secreted protein n=1 Tax=Soboliphyme baturini TaxID=241478 RepID=A0A183IP10_9BILA|nr:unnamed protein product [Soboliphyme baturini]
MAFAFMVYCLYLMECWHCRTRFDLMCKCDVHAVYEYVKIMQISAPVVWWQAICYHYFYHLFKLLLKPLFSGPGITEASTRVDSIPLSYI